MIRMPLSAAGLRVCLLVLYFALSPIQPAVAQTTLTSLGQKPLRYAPASSSVPISWIRGRAEWRGSAEQTEVVFHNSTTVDADSPNRISTSWFEVEFKPDGTSVVSLKPIDEDTFFIPLKQPGRSLAVRHPTDTSVEFSAIDTSNGNSEVFGHRYDYFEPGRSSFRPLVDGGFVECRDGGFFNEVTLFDPDGTVRSAKHHVSDDFVIDTSDPLNSVCLRAWPKPDSGVITSRAHEEYNDVQMALDRDIFIEDFGPDGARLWAKRAPVPGKHVQIEPGQDGSILGLSHRNDLQDLVTFVFCLDPQREVAFALSNQDIRDPLVRTIPDGGWVFGGTVPAKGANPDDRCIILVAGVADGTITGSKFLLPGADHEFDIRTKGSEIFIAATVFSTVDDGSGAPRAGTGYVAETDSMLSTLNIKTSYRDVSSVSVDPHPTTDEVLCAFTFPDDQSFEVFSVDNVLGSPAACDLLQGTNETWHDTPSPFTPGSLVLADFPSETFTNPISFNEATIGMQSLDFASTPICEPGGGFPVSFTAQNASVDVFGGDRTLHVTTFGAWAGTSDASWMKIVTPSGGDGYGEGDVTLQFDPNPSPTPRAGSFHINDSSFEFQQAGLTEPVAVMPNGPTELPVGGGSGTLQIVNSEPVDVLASPFIETSIPPPTIPLTMANFARSGGNGNGQSALVSLPAGSATIAWSVDNAAPVTSRTGTIRVVNSAGSVLYTLTINQTGAGGVAPVNLSARTQVGSGSNILIPGFVVNGSGPTKLLVRGVGPTLTDLGVTGAMADPKIALFQGSDMIGGNDTWKDNETELAAIFDEIGAFQLTSDADSAAVFNVDPGAYTVQLSGADGGTGVGIVEMYVLDPAADRGLVNLSARAEVGTGDRVMIPGLVISGDQSVQVLVRGIGPRLGDFGVPDFLDDPLIEVRDATNNVVGSNDDWGTAPDLTSLTNAFGTVGAFELTDGSTDAALLLTLSPGAYTAVIRGKGTSIGVALLEVYFLGPQP